ncbi:MAG: hypothetical protein NUV59_03315 [Patescibacteria group bacterium]|nr:hypothetical protein [Patescibacteria group bacterium]
MHDDHQDKARDAATGTSYVSHKPNAAFDEPVATSLLSSILAVVGLVILVVVIIWGLVHLAGLSGNWFSSIFSRSSASEIIVRAPERATSGEAMTISWEYAPKSEGAYALVYQCQDDLFFVTPGNAGVMSRVPCGAAFILSSTTTAISLTPVASGEGDISVPISIAFVSATDSAAEAQGSAAVLIGQPDAAPVEDSPAIPPQEEAAPKPAQATPPDLYVRIMSVGSDGYGQGIATFDISNVGGSSSGGYYFEAQLPTTAYGQGYKYTSPLQKSLAPGDHIVNTLRFTQAVNGIFSVTVDPSGAVSESTETNNYAYQTLSAYYNQPTYYNNPQPAGSGTGQQYYQYDPNQPQTYYMY